MGWGWGEKRAEKRRKRGKLGPDGKEIEIYSKGT